MFKIASLLLICSLVISCKNTSEKEIEIARTEVAPGEVMQHSSPYKFSLAQWSIHLPIRKGTMDAMDFAEIAKNLGFTGLEYVDQLYEIDETIPYREWVMNLADRTSVV